MSCNSLSFALRRLHLESRVVVIPGLLMQSVVMKPLSWYLNVARDHHMIPFTYNASGQTLAQSGQELAELLRSMKQHTHFDPCCNFVTFSYGGLVLREAFRYLDWSDQNSKIAMIAPPNRGCSYFSSLRRHPFCSNFGGLAVEELCMLEDAHLDQRLGKMPHLCKTVVIAGSRSINPLNRKTKEENDGTIAVSETNMPGYYRHEILPIPHPLLMYHPKTFQVVRDLLDT